MLFTDIMEAKSVLEIPVGDTSEDKKIWFCIQTATNWFEEFLGRKFSLQSRTEYYNGKNSQYLNLKGRPVFTNPTIQVYVDPDGAWGSSTGAFQDSNQQLTYGTDFALKIDQSDGSSRCGTLIRLNDYWAPRSIRQSGLLTPSLAHGLGNIKVVYTAGYANDTLPEGIRMAANIMIGRMRVILPTGMEISSESYEDRSTSLVTAQKNYLIQMVAPYILPYRNWKW